MNKELNMTDLEYRNVINHHKEILDQWVNSIPYYQRKQNQKLLKHYKHSLIALRVAMIIAIVANTFEILLINIPGIHHFIILGLSIIALITANFHIYYDEVNIEIFWIENGLLEFINEHN